MNSATLKTVRELCGLSQSEAAQLAGVSLRTWQYWESPAAKGAAKPNVAELFRGMLDQIQDIVDTLPDYDDDDAPGEIVVTRYRTEADLAAAHPGYPGGLIAHTAAIRQILFTLDGDGVPARVVWDDDPDATVIPGL